MADREELASLARELRQRIESLGRAGVDRIPAPELPPPATAEARPREAASPSPPVPPPPVRPAPRVEAPPSAPVAPRSAPAPVRVASSSLFDEPEIDAPAIPAAERPAALAMLQEEVSRCTKCPILVANRTQTVFGVGNPSARLMFIGEAPGAEEDRRGEPFVGRAGQLLTDMITKGMGLRREDVYIANILKSRPPDNRDPLPDEVANCLPYLERQIDIIRPEFFCLLGRIAAQTLLQTALSMSRLRGKWHRYRGISTIVTWHPAYLLRSPEHKKETWEDLQMLMKAMGIPTPDRKRPA